MANEGIDDALRTALVVYLISHNSSLHRILAPTFKDISNEFAHGFVGMTEEEIELGTLLAAREQLVADIVGNMPTPHKRFLISFMRGESEWHHLGLSGIESLPAVRWRQLNLDSIDDVTRAELVQHLEVLLFP